MIASPLLIPIPILIGGNPLAANSTFNSSMFIAICLAHSMALSSWPSKSSGAPKIAIIASPMYLSTVPENFETADCWAVKALFIM